MRTISIPAVAERRDDVPALLDDLLTEEQCSRPIRHIGDANLAALVARHKWKANHRDVREVARRCRALLEQPMQYEAAARLGITPSTLCEWLSGLGMSGRRDRTGSTGSATRVLAPHSYAVNVSVTARFASALASANVGAASPTISTLNDPDASSS